MSGEHRHIDDIRVFQGLNRLCPNYFHQLIQLIPAIASYADLPGFREGLLIIGDPGPAVFRGLELAQVTLPKIERVSPAVPLDIADLTYSSYLSDSNFISTFSQSIFERMAAGVPYPASGAAPQQITYVWRVDTPARVMRNEDDLVERLIRRFKVEPAVLTALTLDEQIELFRESKVVIGPHGAGLGNIVFCKPGSVLYEMIPHHYVNPAIAQLAQLRGMHYWCDVHRAEERPDLWRHQTPWTVDIDLVERRLELLFSRYCV